MHTTTDTKTTHMALTFNEYDINGGNYNCWSKALLTSHSFSHKMRGLDGRKGHGK